MSSTSTGLARRLQYDVSDVLRFVGLVIVMSLLLTPPIAIFAALFLMQVIRQVRHRQWLSLLMYLDQAVRMNLPLREMIEAAWQSEGWWMRKRLAALERAYFGRGEPLDEALLHASPRTPLRIAAMLGAAERVGRLRTVLPMLMDQEQQMLDQEDENWAFTATYGPLVLLSAIVIVTLLTIFIVPKFAEIFDDFDAPLPAATQILMAFGDWMTGFQPGQLIPGWLLVPPVVLVVWFIGKTYSGRWLLGQVVGSLPGVPGMAGLPGAGIQSWFIARDLSDACVVVREAVLAGMPLPEAARHAAAAVSNRPLQRRLRRWADNLEQGRTPGEAAKAARLPHLLVGAVAATEGTANLPDILRFLAEYYHHKHLRAAALMQSVVLPLTVLLLAVLVGFIVYALFVPLVVLISNTTESVWTY